MIAQRIFTGVVLALITLSIVLYAPLNLFIILAFILTLAMSWEWANLAPLQKNRHKLLYMLLMLITINFLWVSSVPVYMPFLMMTVFWVGSLTFLVHYPDLPKHWQDSWLRAFLGLLALSTFAIALVVIKAFSIETTTNWLLLLLLLVWAADIGAYFAGRWFGKTSLARQVSPGKTVEGVVGGLILSYIVAGFYAYFAAIGGLTFWQFVALVLGVNVFSIIGDLFISMLKRQVHCKDTSQLLPGHGGLLDRLDGLVAVMPVAALWLLLYVQ